MATRGRIPLSRVLEELEDDNASAGPVADGSDDDLGMDSDYYNSSGEGIFFLLLILYKAKYSFTLLLVQKFLKSYAEYDDLDLDPPPASPEPTLSCETLQCMITKND